MEQFTKQISVTEEHLDELNHVNNVVYLQWVQDVAKEHWLHRVDSNINQQFFWVVRSHHLDYKKQVFEGDILDIVTYVVNYKGPFSERAVDFLKGNELVVSARSNWCLLDAQTQKPVRVPDIIKELFGSRE